VKVLDTTPIPSSLFYMGNQPKALIIIILVAFFSVLHSPIHYLEISHNREETVYLRIPISLDNEFTVKYTHSVMKTPVYEHYRVMPDRRILLTETEFSSYGAGLPEKGKYDFEMSSEGFRIYNMNLPFDFIVYRTAPAETGADLTLIIHNTEMPFLSFSADRTPVKITVRKDPMWLFKIREGSE
jgi:hypothetical protein